MLYFVVKIRETKNLVPSEVGLTLYPEKHGNLIKVDVFAFSQKQCHGVFLWVVVLFRQPIAKYFQDLVL